MKTSRHHLSQADAHRIKKCPQEEDSQTVEADMEKLESLTNMAGELALVRNQVKEVYTDLAAKAKPEDVPEPSSPDPASGGVRPADTQASA